MEDDIERVSTMLVEEAYLYAKTNPRGPFLFNGDDSLRMASILSAVAELLAPTIREVEALGNRVEELERGDSNG